MIDPSNYQIKRALISVSDKTGIVDFAKELDGLGIEIYSTGGTAKLLKENGLNVKKVSDLTGFPEVMDGRVKTLHPAIHAGLLADLGNENHVKEMDEHNLESIDLLAVNLYPFEQTLAKEDVSDEEIIENIDIGGPTMLRAAAKNYKWTLPVVNPEDYNRLIEMLKEFNNTIPEDNRRSFASEVFNHTAYYDSKIAQYFQREDKSGFRNKITIPLNITQNLRYGENPQQDAVLCGDFFSIFNKLHGKELSYNNIMDIDAAAKLIIEFEELTFGIIKHTNPCGVAAGENLIEAYDKAFATDTVSPFGGIFIVNRALDAPTAEKIHDIFSEVIIAPEFTSDALDLLMKKKARRLIQVNFDKLREYIKTDLRSVAGGFLLQHSDTLLADEDKSGVVTKREPTDEEKASLMFGWKVVKHVKSNSIVYTKADRTIGIGAGQMSRVDSARIAADKAKLMGLDLTGTTVASDAFFPFADGVEQAAEAGATAVIQPGGSKRDEEVIKAADDRDMAMIFTGMRHFRH